MENEMEMEMVSRQLCESLMLIPENRGQSIKAHFNAAAFVNAKTLNILFREKAGVRGL